MPFPLIATGIKAGVSAFKAKTALGKLKTLGRIGSGVAGFFGSKRKRAEEQAKRAEFSQLLGTQYGALQQAVTDVGQEFATQREFMGESQGLEQQAAVMGYGLGQENLQAQLAATNLQTGAGEQAMQLAQQEFAMQQRARDLQSRERAFGLDLREASRMRDIQAAGFALDKSAAEKGLKSRNYGQSLMDMMEV